MAEPNMLFFLAAVVILGLLGIAFGYAIIRRRGLPARDSDTSDILKRRPVTANPVFWTIVLVTVGFLLATAYYFGLFDTASYSYAHPKGAILHA